MTNNDVTSPMEIYLWNPNLRNWFEQNEIIWKYKNWNLFIPARSVEYEKEKKFIKNNNFPFYHNMLLELIINLEWNWKVAIEMFKKDNSYITNGWLTIMKSLKL